ncbi:MAG: PDZ domain-containing protein, partial [Paracoccaceae bacterium]
SVQTLTADDAQNLGLAEGTEGVVVTEVDSKGSAAEKGIQQGDVIESVNQVKVASAEDLMKQLDAAKAKKREGALLMVDRHGQKSFIVVPFGQA